MLNRSTRLVAAAGIALVMTAISAAVGVAQGGAPHDHASPDRMVRLTEALGVRPGSAVADVGAGGGNYTVKLAHEVGEGGRVYAVDVTESALSRLRSRVSSEKLGNVQVIEGAVDDPRLPVGALDAALIVNAYHEMTEYASMLSRIREALKPGGRLVILEPIADGARERTREQQASQHQIAPDIVVRDLKAAGFDIVALEDPFKATQGHGDHTEWMLVATPNSKLQTNLKVFSGGRSLRKPGVRFASFGVWSLAFGVDLFSESAGERDSCSKDCEVGRVRAIDPHGGLEGPV